MGLSDKISNALTYVLFGYLVWNLFINHKENPKLTNLLASEQTELLQSALLLNTSGQLNSTGWARNYVREYNFQQIYPVWFGLPFLKSLRVKKTEKYSALLGDSMATVTLRQTLYSTTASVEIFNFESKELLSFEETSWFGYGSQAVPKLADSPFNCTQTDYIFQKGSLLVKLEQSHLAKEEICRFDLQVLVPGKLKLMARSDRKMTEEDFYEVLPVFETRRHFLYKHHSFNQICSGLLSTNNGPETTFGNDKCTGAMTHTRGVTLFKTNYISGSAIGKTASGQKLSLHFGGGGSRNASSVEDFFKLGNKVHKLNSIVITHDPLNLMNGMVLKSNNTVEETKSTADVVFTANRDYKKGFNYFFLGAEIKGVFGTFSGSVTDENGKEIKFEDVKGQVEWGKLKW